MLAVLRASRGALRTLPRVRTPLFGHIIATPGFPSAGFQRTDPQRIAARSRGRRRRPAAHPADLLRARVFVDGARWHRLRAAAIWLGLGRQGRSQLGATFGRCGAVQRPQRFRLVDQDGGLGRLGALQQSGDAIERLISDPLSFSITERAQIGQQVFNRRARVPFDT